MSKKLTRVRGYLQSCGIRTRNLILWLLAVAAVLAACFGAMGLSAGEGRIFPVYISEVLASNTAYPNADGRCSDFIELHNEADYPVDLTGFQLGDIGGSTRYAFPSGTVMEPGAYLVVYCDKTVDEPDYAPFGISRAGGESFYLIGSNRAVVDSVITLAMDMDESMVRTSAEEWEVTLSVTPGKANDTVSAASDDIYNPGVSPVRISEFSGADNNYVNQYTLRCDWVELVNTSAAAVDISGYSLSDNVGNDKYIFPAGTVLEAGAYYVVNCSDRVADPAIAPFGISVKNRERLALKDAQGRIIQILAADAPQTGSVAMDDNGRWAATEMCTPGFENTAEGFAACLAALGAGEGTVRISEIMAAGQTVIADSYSQFSDWVELYNTSGYAVTLDGWSLSDDPAQPDKWIIPSLTLAPGERKVIFCSGRGTTIGQELHAEFALSAAGESLSLYTYLGSMVDRVNFPEGEENTSFTFDGGQMCVSDLPTPGYENTQAGYEAFCAARVPAGPIAIWEVMSSNDSYLPQALGVCYDWVELCNISQETVSLNGFTLSDDPDFPAMHALRDVTLAPGARITVMLSGDESLSGTYDHAGFTLNAAQDSLYLYDAAGNLLDYVMIRDIPQDMSLGRGEDVGGFFYMKPTPGKANAEGFRLISAMPTGSYEPGVYSGASGFTLTLEGEGDIYYTTDGSEPTAEDNLYEGPLQIDQTTALRAVCLVEGKQPGKIYTATFVVGDVHDLPVVSLVTDPDYLWGYNGVYRNGDESVKDINFPANVAYSGEDGTFSMDNEMSLHGATTVTAFNKKSFTVRFQDKYDGALHYDVFEDGEVTSFRSLLIRTAHESTYSTQMHDTLIAQVAAECTDVVMTQKYKYVALYLNGEYWGLYALREHHTESHYASYMQVPVDTVEMVRYATDDDGTLREIYDFCASNTFRSDENYAYAKSVLDVESFADWIIFQSYVCNIDINSNMRYYRSSVDGLWRCALVDLDLGMTDGVAAFSEVANTFHHGRIVRALLENEEFQDLLATRMAQYLAGPMSDEAMVRAIDEMAAIIRQEAEWEEARWNTPVFAWESFVEDMKDFCTGRAAEVIESLRYQLGWSYEKTQSYFGELMG